MSNLWVSAGIEVTDVTRVFAAKEALAKLVAETVKEPGCIKFEIHQHLSEPQKFTLWEIWETADSLTKHFEQVHTIEYLSHNYTEVNYIEKMSGPIG
ncbi:putative quinol monooxygenase [Curvivirga sp.]|uniref:putative quinol monooxygenase n=1 Tax=Curvivirga sp. TaxID=2856848 RepID=UPI003B59D60F